MAVKSREIKVELIEFAFFGQKGNCFLLKKIAPAVVLVIFKIQMRLFSALHSKS